MSLDNLISRLDAADGTPTPEPQHEPLPTLPAPPPTRRDALEGALSGTGLSADFSVDSNPTSGLGWYGEQELERLQIERAVVRYVEQGHLIPPALKARIKSISDGPFGDGYAYLRDGSRIAICELIDRRRRECYDLLAQGADDATIRHALLCDQQFVDKIRKQFFEH